MSRLQPFDLGKAVPAAWALLWADNLRKRAAGEDFRGNTTFLTASDLEGQVRQFAGEQNAGKAWGSAGRAWGNTMYNSGIRISTGRPGTLLDYCRDWLHREVRAGRLEEQTMGRGHISGARYRPAGEGTTEREQKTMDAKRKRRENGPTWHISASGTFGGRPWCTADRKRSFYSYRRSSALTTKEREQVNCRRCLNLLALRGDKMPVPAVREEASDA